MHDICASQPARIQMQMQRGMLLALHPELADLAIAINQRAT